MHANANALSRPVLSTEIVEDKNDAYISSKYLDPYEDDNLIHYLKFKKQNAGLSVKQIKRIEKASKYFKLEIDNLGGSKLFFLADKHSKPLFVPKFELRDELVKRAHLLGHSQVESTLKRLKEEFYWRNMKENVEKIVRSCVECCRHHSVPIVEHEAKVLEISSLSQRVGIDLTLGFPKTNEGFIGLLVITEYLSKYVMAYPIKSKMASEIAEKLFDYISLFGPPKEILSDQGTEFNNEIVHSLLKASGVEHRVTSAYHPRTNGMTERMNGVIVESIKKHASIDKLEWNKWVPFVLFAYRTRVHSSTNFTSFELLFGRKVNSFSDFSRDISISESDKIWNRSIEIRQLFDITHQIAINNIHKSQEKQVKTQNRSHNVTNIPLPIGTQVYVKTTGLHNKLYDYYKGPFTVVEFTQGGNYKLKNTLNQTLDGSFVRSRLKPVSEVTKEKFYKIEKILDDRVNENGTREFLIKWQDSELGAPSWEPAENFVDLDIINDYLKKKNEKKYNNIDNEKKQNLPAKRSRGRPRKINTVNFLSLIALFLIVLPLTCANELINGNYLYCSSDENNINNPFIQFM